MLETTLAILGCHSHYGGVQTSHLEPLHAEGFPVGLSGIQPAFLLGVSVSSAKLYCSNKQPPNLMGTQQQRFVSHSCYVVSTGHCSSDPHVLFILGPRMKGLPPSGTYSCGREEEERWGHRMTSSFHSEMQHVTSTLPFTGASHMASPARDRQWVLRNLLLGDAIGSP